MKIEMIELLVGGLLLVLAVLWKLRHLVSIVNSILPVRFGPPVTRRLNAVIRLCVGVVGFACLIDPLISGNGILLVRAPPESSTTLPENLRARIVPLGLLGPAGGDYIIVSRFDGRGMAAVPVSFHAFEVSARVDVFDVSRPEPVVATTIVCVSPFVRRQLWPRLVDFQR
jgi:hypothetical protein